MHKSWARIVIWLGIMAVLTLIAMGLWSVVLGGSQTTVGLKWLQFLQMTGTFLLPPLLCAWIWDERHKPFVWLCLDRIVPWQVFVWAIAIMICALPGINFLADLNSRIVLPERWAAFEQMLKQMEQAATELTERFLHTDTFDGLLVNFGLMAVLPALAEELSFRGTLQQILSNHQSTNPNPKSQIHIAIWVTAIIFSAIHMQFYGFIPRMLMGALFGYMFLWTGSLWIPIVMHFTNNGLAVITYYLTAGEGDAPINNYADTLGAGTTWWLGILSLLTVGVLLWGFTSRGLPRYDRRTHIQ